MGYSKNTPPGVALIPFLLMLAGAALVAPLLGPMMLLIDLDAYRTVQRESRYLALRCTETSTPHRYVGGNKSPTRTVAEVSFVLPSGQQRRAWVTYSPPKPDAWIGAKDWEVLEVGSRWAGQPFPCFVDPADPTVVVATRARSYTPVYALGYALYTVVGTWGLVAIVRGIRREEKKG